MLQIKLPVGTDTFLLVSLTMNYWARGYKNVFMLNSAEHETLNAHKYKNIKKFRFVFRVR